MKTDQLPDPFTLVFKFGPPMVIGLFLLIGGCQCFYTVDQNEVGAVTRFGSLISEKPEVPGFHFKAPLGIDTVHLVRMSLDKIPIAKINAKTSDNQFVELDVNLTYKTADPFKVLFKVGDIGVGSRVDKIVPYVQSHVLDVFGTVNATQVQEEKKSLESQILTLCKAQILDLFGEDIEDVQITRIEYSDLFKHNVEVMVQTRTEQQRAINILGIRETEAKTAIAMAKGVADSNVATATGQRDASIAAAQGQKQATILAAEANAQQVRLVADAKAYAEWVQAQAQAKATQAIGEADGAALAAKVKGAGDPDKYAAILRANASLKWDGSVPKFQFGGTTGNGQVLPILPLDKDMLK